LRTEDRFTVNQLEGPTLTIFNTEKKQIEILSHIKAAFYKTTILVNKRFSLSHVKLTVPL
jgi:hypothetical protein